MNLLTRNNWNAHKWSAARQSRLSPKRAKTSKSKEMCLSLAGQEFLSSTAIDEIIQMDSAAFATPLVQTQLNSQTLPKRIGWLWGTNNTTEIVIITIKFSFQNVSAIRLSFHETFGTYSLLTFEFNVLYLPPTLHMQQCKHNK